MPLTQVRYGWPRLRTGPGKHAELTHTLPSALDDIVKSSLNENVPPVRPQPDQPYILSCELSAGRAPTAPPGTSCCADLIPESVRSVPLALPGCCSQIMNGNPGMAERHLAAIGLSGRRNGAWKAACRPC